MHLIFDSTCVGAFVGTVNPTMLGLAIVATLATLGLLAWTLGRSPRTAEHPEGLRLDRRRPSHTERRDPREALALLGDALAATHNPRVLLPVVLEVIAEATGAKGGQIFSAGEEVAWVGVVGNTTIPTLRVTLGPEDEGETTLILYPPDEEFSQQTEELAEWLAAQAGVALENARLHDVVQRQAITDDLTGLVNRRRFIAALQAEVERARRFGSPLTVVLADLDDFKSVNDVYGHPAGDDVLRSFAALVQSHIRDVDVPGRIGGEEFAILLPETDAEGAARVAERMRHSLSTVPVVVTEGRMVSVTSSFGVAELGGGQSGEDLMMVADAALYRAKAQGKNRVATTVRAESS